MGITMSPRQRAAYCSPISDSAEVVAQARMFHRRFPKGRWEYATLITVNRDPSVFDGWPFWHASIGVRCRPTGTVVPMVAWPPEVVAEVQHMGPWLLNHVGTADTRYHHTATTLHIRRPVTQREHDGLPPAWRERALGARTMSALPEWDKAPRPPVGLSIDAGTARNGRRAG